MKRYIDLFKQQNTQNTTVQLLNKVKKAGIIMLGLFVVALLIEGVIYAFFMFQISKKEAVIKRYNTFIIQNQVLDSKINYFAFKYGILKQSLTQDADIPYYTGLLNTFIYEADFPVTISALSIDNQQLVKFTLDFNTYADAVDFMSHIESHKLPDYFESLKLKEFTITGESQEQYTLEFEGIFKKVTYAVQS